MEATVKKVDNGFLITTPEGQVFVAERLSTYSYNSFTVIEVLKDIFEPKTVEPVEAA